MSSRANHKLAPICAAWVKEMREVFGEDVKVLYVKEGDFEMGEPCRSGDIGGLVK
jgi:hypothetical protein